MPDYLTGTGYRITPVLAVLPPGLAVSRCPPHEVESIFELPDAVSCSIRMRRGGSGNTFAGFGANTGSGHIRNTISGAPPRLFWYGSRNGSEKGCSAECVSLVFAGILALLSGPALAQTRINPINTEFPLAGARRQGHCRAV